MKRATRRIAGRTCLGAPLLAALSMAAPAAPSAEPPAPPGNRLAGESSPYLLLHADDPVDWYPWGPEAFARAREEDKPLFLSIGYSACYWCHVMEREVFSDPEIAALMNRWFVNVKVDREERPDVDEVYVTAAQLLSGSAGWPASLFLTPELEPFFAGSYFPPEPRDGLPGFPSLLRRLHDGWGDDRRPELEAVAKRVTAAVGDVLAGRRAPAAEVPPAAAAGSALDAVRESFDPEWGGFAPAPAYRPKFPQVGDLLLLVEAWKGGDEEAGRHVVATLRAMGRGAIHDQLAGGFHRYTVDRKWRVPHFEKMLYDNALLAEVLVAVAERSGDPELGRLARRTLDFLLEEMALPGGAFLSSLDAESPVAGPGTEGHAAGAYYTWTSEEVRRAVGDQGFAFLARPLGLEDEGETEGGRHTLYWSVAPSPELLDRAAPRLETLREARDRRPAPAADDKVLADWNGLAVAALARGAVAFEEPRYLEAARGAAGFQLDRLRRTESGASGGTLRHAWRGGEATVPAFLDDYAFLVHGLLALAEAEEASARREERGTPRAPGAARWTTAAVALAAEMEERLGHPEGGYFFAAGDDPLPVRSRTAVGRATPAGNAVAILDLLALSERTGESRYRERAAAALRAFAHQLERYPQAVPDLARALLRYHAVEKDRSEGAAEEPAARHASR